MPGKSAGHLLARCVRLPLCRQSRHRIGSSGHVKTYTADTGHQTGCKRMLTELLATSGITGAVAGAAIVWLLRNWLATRLSAAVKHEYDEKLEKLRVQLQQERERDIESLKATYQQVLSAQ